MAEQNPYAAYSDPKLYDDGTGRGAMLGTVPVADETTAKKNKATVRSPDIEVGAMVAKQLQDDTDYLNSLFDGEQLSEEFKEKAKTIFEAAIHEKVSIIEAHILEAAKEIIEEQNKAAAEVISENTSATTNTLVEQLDGYLDYVITEWMEQNKVAVERGLRTEIAENFIHGLKELFENSFIDVPQEKYNVLDDIYEANEELQEGMNKLIKENMSLKNEIKAHLCAEEFMKQTSGLADTEVEKLAKLAEGIEFDSVEQYSQKVALLRESYFNRAPATSTTQVAKNQQFGQVPLNEESNVSTGSTDPLMENVVNALSLLNKNKPKIEKVIRENTAASRVASLINPGISQDRYV